MTTPAPPYAAALQKAAAMLETLSNEELEAVASGRGSLVFRPAPVTRAPRRTPARRALGIDIAAVVEQINTFETPGEVSDYLDGLDARFTVPVLKEIARAIGPTVATGGRTRSEVRRDIIEGTAGFRVRSHAMSGGAWG